jgi:hypothetical protein
MKSLLACLFTVALASSASAADLPDYKATDVCAPAAMSGCWESQLHFKSQLERWITEGNTTLRLPDAKLLRFCIAEAAYWGGGYIDISACIQMERWKDQVDAFDRAIGGWGPRAIGEHCDDMARKVGEPETVCLLAETTMALRLHARGHAVLAPSAFARCLALAKAQRSYAAVEEGCMTEALPQN